MKTCKHILPKVRLLSSRGVFLVLAILLFTGCEVPEDTSAVAEGPSQGTLLARIRLSTLTGFEADPNNPDQVLMKAIVELFNDRDEQVQIPCVFRFELYAFQSLSAESRGRRLVLWPDQNVTSKGRIEAHWKDYLKAYQFNFPIDFFPQSGQQYVLEATCLFGAQRYTDLIKIAF